MPNKRKLMHRLRAACRTNEPQATTVSVLTVLNLLACVVRDGTTPWWLWAVAALFWPAFAFAGNFAEPVPKERS